MVFRRSIRTILTALEGATLFITVIFVIILFIVIRDEFRERSQRRQVSDIGKIDLLIGSFIRENLQSFTTLAAMPHRDAAAPLLTDFSELYYCTAQFTISRIIRSEPGDFIFPGYDLSTSPVAAFLKTVTTAAPAHSTMSRSPHNNRLGVHFALPIDGGYLVGRIGLDKFRESLLQIARYADSTVILATRDGYILSSTSERLPIYLLPDRGQTRITLGGEEYLYTRKRSTSLDNDIAMLTPQSAVYSFTGPLVLFFILFIVLMAVLITVKILWQSRHITLPLGQFSAELSRWEAGAPWPDLPKHFLAYDEIGSLFASFSDKIRRITEAVTALQRGEELFSQLAGGVREVFWLSDARTGRIEYLNPAVEEVWGRQHGELTVFPGSFAESMHPDDRHLLDSLPDDETRAAAGIEVRITRPDGVQRWIWIRAYPVADAGGRVIRLAGVAEDITERRFAEKSLRVQRDLGVALSSISNLDVALGTILDAALSIEGLDAGGIYLVDPVTGAIDLACVRGFSDEFMNTVRHYEADTPNARAVIAGVPIYVESSLETMDLLRLVAKEMGVAEGIKSVVIAPIRHLGDSIACMNIVSKTRRDVPEVTRNTLEAIAVVIGSTIVRVRSQAQVAASLTEKEILLKEIHHRVKNNMQIIVSLLDLQSRNITDPELLQTFDDSRNRIRAMALIHDRLYQDGDFSQIEFSSYSSAIARQLMATNRAEGKITLSMDTEQLELPLTQAIPCALLLNEMMTNALKYAFPEGHRGPRTITISLHRVEDHRISLAVSDNGVGLPAETPTEAEGSLGMTLIGMLTRQIGGSLSVWSGEGTRITITFPAP